MPRRRMLRKVVTPPSFEGYKPYGEGVNKNGSIDLLYEEYEALKLADYDYMNHEEAAKLMGISRPTFARIYETARRKVAKALVETKTIKSVYGNAWLENDWYTCEDCTSKFTLPQELDNRNCPLCNSSLIITSN